MVNIYAFSLSPVKLFHIFAKFKKMSAAQKKSQEEIIAQFNRLRQEQRNLAAKLSELQMDLNEHK